MVHQYSPSYPHRLNAYGSYDSICTLCQQTVATAMVEAELSQHEETHECNPIQLLQVRQFPLRSRAIAI
jgi:hypothetical protein